METDRVDVSGSYSVVECALRWVVGCVGLFGALLPAFHREIASFGGAFTGLCALGHVCRLLAKSASGLFEAFG